MDVWRITIAALRRWYVLLPLLALTGLAVVQAGTQTAPEYEARASGMLAPARIFSDIPNPYNTVNGAQEALVIVLNSTEARQSIAAQGMSAGYEVSAAPRSVIFQVVTRADTTHVAEETGQAVLDKAAEELETRQSNAGLSEREQYTLEILEAPAVISVIESNQARTQAIVGVLGAGLSLLVAVLFDDIIGFFRRLRAKRRQASSEASVEDEDRPDQLTLDDISTVEPETQESHTIGHLEPVGADPNSGDVRSTPLVARSRAPQKRQRSHTSLLGEGYPASNSSAVATEAPDKKTEPIGADDAADSAEQAESGQVDGDSSRRHRTSYRP